MSENRFAQGIKNSKETTDNLQKEKEALKESKSETETNIDNEVSNDNTVANISKADIKAILKQNQKPKAKTHSLYLDDEVFEKLQKHAKSNKTSVSKILNDLLKSIL